MSPPPETMREAENCVKASACLRSRQGDTPPSPCISQTGIFACGPRTGVCSTVASNLPGDTWWGNPLPVTHELVRPLERVWSRHSGGCGHLFFAIKRLHCLSYIRKMFSLHVPRRFCVNVQRENFPPDTNGHVQPAHTLTLLPPLTVSNLLPCDIQFYLLDSKVRKFVKRGKEIAIFSVS